MKQSRLFRSRAPLRISFAGGGTDVSPFAEEHGGAVVSATINKFAYATLRPRDDSRYTLHNLDDGEHASGHLTRDIEHDGGLTLAAAVVRNLGIERGFDLTLFSDAPWGSGLGSSSTHIVAVLGVFARWLGLRLSLNQIAELSFKVERQDLQLAGGRQDQYSASFGGFNFLEFAPRGVSVQPLRVKQSTLNELHFRSVLCSVGRTRQSSAIHQDQLTRYTKGETETVASLMGTKALAYEVKAALLEGRLDRLAELLHEGWMLKRRLSPLVTNPEIDALYEAALAHGAAGGRLLGAGGGGHMLFLCADGGRKQLTSFLEQRGYPIIPFSFEKQGLTRWSVGSG